MKQVVRYCCSLRQESSESRKLAIHGAGIRLHRAFTSTPKEPQSSHRIEKEMTFSIGIVSKSSVREMNSKKMPTRPSRKNACFPFYHPPCASVSSFNLAYLSSGQYFMANNIHHVAEKTQ